MKNQSEFDGKFTNKQKNSITRIVKRMNVYNSVQESVSVEECAKASRELKEYVRLRDSLNRQGRVNSIADNDIVFANSNVRKIFQASHICPAGQLIIKKRMYEAGQGTPVTHSSLLQVAKDTMAFKYNYNVKVEEARPFYENIYDARYGKRTDCHIKSGNGISKSIEVEFGNGAVDVRRVNKIIDRHEYFGIFKETMIVATSFRVNVAELVKRTSGISLWVFVEAPRTKYGLAIAKVV